MDLVEDDGGTAALGEERFVILQPPPHAGQFAVEVFGAGHRLCWSIDDSREYPGLGG